ncbi:MAG TPA: M20/M25/M40 family metallo-hydrolase [Gemmatimonadaceae bacterium]|jgi:glutamate carboxypeptidase
MPTTFSFPARALATCTIGAALVISHAAPLTAQTLTPIEQRMRTYIEQHKADEVALLAKSVNIKSQTLDLAGVRAVGALFSSELQALGFKTEWVPMPTAMNRAGHLLATRTGTSGKRLLLIGHLDTVVEGDTLNFAMLDSTKAKGAGGSDMKGGDVAIIYALKAMKDAGVLDNTSITVIMSGDEESPGDPLSVARAALIDAGKHNDIALAFEGGNRSDATVARRGSSSWLLTVSGHGAHSAGIFGDAAGFGSNFEAARILNEFRVQLAGTPSLTFSPSVIVGGTDVAYDSTKVAGSSASKLNIVAAHTTVAGDLRFLTEGQKDSARARMRDIATHNNLPGTSATITFGDDYPAMAPTPANYAVLAVYDSASRALGYGPVTALDPSKRGAGDISFVGPIMTGLDGLGVLGSGSHTPMERVDIATMPMQTERAAVLIYRLTHPAGTKTVP